MKFVHLHVQSSYSLLNSTLRIEELVKTAVEQGYEAIALTDENVLYGAVPFYKACKKHQIKPLIGMILHIQSILQKDKTYFPLVLLAKTNVGYRQLLQLSTFVQTTFKEGIPYEVLQAHSKDLIAISPSLGEVNQCLFHQSFAEGEILYQKLANIFHDHFYLAIEPDIIGPEPSISNKVFQFCQEKKVPSVVTNPVRYAKKEDAIIHECLQCIKKGTKLKETDLPLQKQQNYLKAEAEVVQQFHLYEESLQNTVEIANMCDLTIDLGQVKLPKYPLPEGVTADQFLKSLCYKGLQKRYPSEVPMNAWKRLDYELSVIQKMNYSDYFLIVWDFIHYAHKHHILVGPGRGSAAGSLVAYALGITNIDPLKYHLLFERFLNPERISMPDIDIDFPDHRRDEMIRYVSEKYGQEHVAQIITFGTLAARASLRDVGRVLGIPITEINRLTKLVPARPGITLNQAVQESVQLQHELSQNKDAKKLFSIAKKIEGLPRHTSTHAAGIVMSESPLTNVVPLQEGHDGVLLTQYSMEILEEIGLLKMDFLGLRNLTLIEMIQNLIYEQTGTHISLKDIPMNDAKTFSLLSAGDTTGVFQFESAGIRKVLRHLKPTNFEDIVAVNALYRPGPMEYISTYIDRKHGNKPIVYPHPDLKEILEPTYGVIIYQEQIMQIAAKMAGFTLGEADLLRRAVSKKKREVLEKERKHFTTGCIQKGYKEEIAEKVYDVIVRFANYGFNRSHAVAYSVIAYWLAYLKANYPLYFMTALLSSVIGNEDKIAQYVGEIRKKQLTILPPSINKSNIHFQVEEGNIRFSLVPIKNVGMVAIKEILQSRKKGNFTDLFDFCARVSLKNVNRRVIESLVLSGCFDEFGYDRAILLASIDAAMEYAELANEEKGGLFLPDDIVPKPQYVRVAPFAIQDKLQFEKEILGFYLSHHPIEPYKHALMQRHAIQIADVPTRVGATVDIGVLISELRVIKSKKGELMAFLTLSDETGEMEAVIFPSSYKKYARILKKNNILMVQGNVTERNQQVQIIVNRVATLNHVKTNAVEKLYLKVDKKQQEAGKLHQIKKILKQFSGPTNVFIHYAENQKTILLPNEWSIKITEQCIHQLKAVLGEKNVVIKK